MRKAGAVSIPPFNLEAILRTRYKDHQSLTIEHHPTIDGYLIRARCPVCKQIERDVVDLSDVQFKDRNVWVSKLIDACDALLARDCDLELVKP